MNDHDNSIITRAFTIKPPSISMLVVKEQIEESLVVFSFCSNGVAKDQITADFLTAMNKQGQKFRKLTNESLKNSARSAKLAREIIDYIKDFISTKLSSKEYLDI